MDVPWRAHLMLLAAAAIYSGYNVLLADTLSSVSATGLSLFREIVAVPALLAWAWHAEYEKKWPDNDWRRFVILGTILGAFQLCFAVGVALTDAATAAIFQCVEPTTAAIVGALAGSEPCSVHKVTSAALAGAGVAVLQFNFKSGAVATTTSRLFGCALLWSQGLGIAAYCLVQKSLVRGRHGPVTVTAYAYVVSLGIMTAAATTSSLAGLESPAPFSRPGVAQLVEPKALLAVAYAALLASVLGYTLRARANKHLDAATLVLYNAVQPPLTALFSFFLAPRRASYGLPEVISTLLVVAAVAIAASDTHNQAPKPPTCVADPPQQLRPDSASTASLLHAVETTTTN
ncbi:hypothetical protein CTAYLR_007540 [Chrysophaeum taylorii]|uniref:EamA domain-containing protein n=1 Tax=Chrysophaeum taylorii TaxID=2483200 RepID=A0AAD7U5U9_9STRA|nr:hypothetical protein CTAYLR_007540 [Chrysophaeum taylorii]